MQTKRSKENTRHKSIHALAAARAGDPPWLLPANGARLPRVAVSSGKADTSQKHARIQRADNLFFVKPSGQWRLPKGIT